MRPLRILCLSKDKLPGFLLSLLLLVLPVLVTAQLFPVSNWYIQNPIALNPAHAGSDEALSISLQYRNQWLGVYGAPETMTFTAHAPTRNNRVNLGFQVLKDSYGIYNYTNLGGMYAYKIQFKQAKLSMGLAVSVGIQEEKWDQLNALETDDEQLMESREKRIEPNFSLGAIYTTEKYFFGFALPKILSHEWSLSKQKNTIQNKFSNYNYFCYGGYKFRINEQIDFYPTFLTKYSSASNLQFDISPQIVIKDRISTAITYRTNGVVSGLLRCRINQQLSAAYSYEFETKRNFEGTGGSHEIMINYLFKYELKVESPR